MLAISSLDFIRFLIYPNKLNYNFIKFDKFFNQYFFFKPEKQKI